MRRNDLGQTGIAVSEIAFGGVEIGVPYGIGVHAEADMLSRQDAIRLLQRATDEDINFFDTARMYGESESIMGEAFRDRRADIVLASKCKHLRRPDGHLVSQTDLRKFIRKSLEDSLSSLKTDYIDLFMVHYADEEILASEIVAETFSEIKRQGLVRAIGVSVYKAEETKRAVETGIWDAIQLPFNLMDQSHGQYFDQARENGVGIIVRSVLMRGFLSDRAVGLHPALQTVEDHIRSYRGFLGADFVGLPQLAMQFALGHEAVSSVLVGIDKQQYLADAVSTVKGKPMDEELLSELRGLAYPDPAFLNLADWDKNGWL